MSWLENNLFETYTMPKDFFGNKIFSNNNTINTIIDSIGQHRPEYLDYKVKLEILLKDRDTIDKEIVEVRKSIKQIETEVSVRVHVGQNLGQNALWYVIPQQYFSEKSSIKQLPAGFNIVNNYFGWKPDTINFDIGGGRYDIMTKVLAEVGVSSFIYDPFNRTIWENMTALDNCANGKSDTVTIFNVLNVIQERDVQQQILYQAENALKIGGSVYVRSTYKNPKGVSEETKSGTFQHALSQKDYLVMVKEVFPNALLEHGIIHATK
jgi:hypothetical protein